MRAGIRLIDHMIRRSLKLVEFSADPECILRIQLSRSAHSVDLGALMMLKDDPILAIHVWNEHMPKISSQGADLQWALKLRHMLMHSFKLLAEELKRDPQFTHLTAICGTSAMFSFTDHVGGLRMMQHLGFTVLPYHRPLGKFGEFWENLFAWGMMWAYNEASLHGRKFWHLQRTEIWISMEEFMARFEQAGQP